MEGAVNDRQRFKHEGVSSYHSGMLDLLKSRFGYDSFRPLQEEIITTVLAGKDALVVMPTGVGKSLCYQLPAVSLDGLTLVVSPLIALMKDQVDALNANGINAAFINSTLSATEISRVQAQAKSGALKLLYAAPERLALPEFRDFLRTVEVNLIAVDEAHCISEWGHDFRPDYRDLKTLRRAFPSVPVIALTATATEKVREDIIAQLGLAQGEKFLASFDRSNLTYLVKPKQDRFRELLTLLRKHGNGPTIIYCISRKDTEALASDLVSQGFKALAYHAGVDGHIRKRTQEKFIGDEVPIVVATVAFGMGINKADVRLVVHYDLPKSLEGYYQETGRAGRDGLPSECVLFYSYADKIKQDYFIDQMEDAAEQQNARQKLAQMLAFAQVQTCRRKFLLEYFGERWDHKSCSRCDVCLSPSEEFDATEIAQKILSTVIRTGERFGAGHVIDVMRGAATKRVIDLGHDRLSVHGIARTSSADELKQVVRSLTERGLLRIDGDQRPTLSVTPTGRSFLNNREQLSLTRPKHSEVPSTGQQDSDLAHDQELFESLRTLRRRIADERGVPPFVIFHDTTLREMASRLPKDRDDFSRISGVGHTKLEQFSQQFLEVIAGHISVSTPKEDVPRGNDRKGIPNRGSSDTIDQTNALLSQKLTLSQIANQRGLTERTIIGHLERLVLKGESLDLDYLMPQTDRLQAIQSAFQQTGDLFLKPAQELLGEEYSYQELWLARIGLLYKGLIS